MIVDSVSTANWHVQSWKSGSQLAQDGQREAAVPAPLLASPPKLRAWLAKRGVKVPNIQRETLEAVLEDPDVQPEVARVLDAQATFLRNHFAQTPRRLAPGGAG